MACPRCPDDECIAAFGQPCTVIFDDAPVMQLHPAYMSQSGAKNVPLSETIRAFGGNVHRATHISSPLFRAACLIGVN